MDSYEFLFRRRVSIRLHRASRYFERFATGLTRVVRRGAPTPYAPACKCVGGRMLRAASTGAWLRFLLRRVSHSASKTLWSVIWTMYNRRAPYSRVARFVRRALSVETVLTTDCEAAFNFLTATAPATAGGVSCVGIKSGQADLRSDPQKKLSQTRSRATLRRPFTYGMTRSAACS